ncbi:MAG TPA: hypothetical protein VF008_32255, partial [Niastella sp.]
KPPLCHTAWSMYREKHLFFDMLKFENKGNKVPMHREQKGNEKEDSARSSIVGSTTNNKQ